MLYKTALQWKAYFDAANGAGANSEIRILLDILSATEQQSSGPGVTINRPLLEELEIDVDADTFTIADQLIGREIVAIVAEDNSGLLVSGAALRANISDYTATKFTDRYLMQFGVMPTHVAYAGELSFPLIESNDLAITLNEDHNLSKLHIYHINPNANNLYMNKVITADFTADTPNTLSHNLGKQARFVTFRASDNSELTLDWIPDPANPNSKIIVTSTVDLTGVTVSIIAF